MREQLSLLLKSRANKAEESGNSPNGTQAKGQVIGEQVLTRTGQRILSGVRESVPSIVPDNSTGVPQGVCGRDSITLSCPSK